MKTEITSQTCQLLTAKDAAALCRLSKRSWFRLNSSARIPAPVRISGSVRWKHSDVEKWISLGCPNRKEFEARLEAENV